MLMINRKTITKGYIMKEEEAYMLIHLLYKVGMNNHSDKRLNGMVLTTMEELSGEVSMSTESIKASLAALVETGRIVLTKNGFAKEAEGFEYMVITIKNMDRYTV